jgi:hypothetical protein
MKQNLFFAIALAVLLFAAGFNAWGQEQTAPLPPPDREASIIPPPERAAPEQAPARRTPARTPAPAGTPAPAQQAPAARQTPAAQQAPAAQQTPAAQQAPARQQAPAKPKAPPAVLPAKGLFWGFTLGAGSQIPDANANDMSWYSGYDWVNAEGYYTMFNNGALLGYDFGLFTGQVEFRIGNENVVVDMVRNSRGNDSPSLNDQLYFFKMRLQVPLVAKMDFHLWRFVLQPLVGIHLNFALYDDLECVTPLLGWTAGGTAGFHLGRGFLFTEFRYLSDLGNVEDMDGYGLYHSSATLLSIGYQYYFK